MTGELLLFVGLEEMVEREREREAKKDRRGQSSSGGAGEWGALLQA